MCFAVSIFASTHDVETALGAVFDDGSAYEPFFHVSGFVHPSLPIVTNDRPDAIQQFSWGLVPRWVKTSEQAGELAKKTLNARSETMFEKPSFRDAARKRRALLPVNGFVEWRHEGDLKIPHLISLRNEPLEKSVMTLGALWEEWVNPDSGVIRNTFTIATTEANELMSYVHNNKQRMPVVIKPEDRATWLAESDQETLSRLVRPLEEGILQAVPVSRGVSRIKVNQQDVTLLNSEGDTLW